jgi:hypothetical protein
MDPVFASLVDTVVDAAVAMNRSVLEFYWTLGKVAGEVQTKYGKRDIARLAHEVNHRAGRSVSLSLVYRARRYALSVDEAMHKRLCGRKVSIRNVYPLLGRFVSPSLRKRLLVQLAIGELDQNQVRNELTEAGIQAGPPRNRTMMTLSSASIVKYMDDIQEQTGVNRREKAIKAVLDAIVRADRELILFSGVTSQQQMRDRFCDVLRKGMASLSPAVVSA